MMLTACSGLQGMRFTCIAMEEQSITEEIYYFNGTGYLPVKFRSQRRSLVYKASIPKEFFSFYVKGPINPDGVQTYRIAGQVPVSRLTQRMLFLVEGRSNGRFSLGILPVDDRVSEFPAASFRFINITSKMLAIKFAGEKFRIVPKESVTIQTKVKKEDFQPVHMINSAGETLFKASWYVNSRMRELVIIHPIENDPTRKIGLKLIPGIAPIMRVPASSSSLEERLQFRGFTSVSPGVGK